MLCTVYYILDEIETDVTEEIHNADATVFDLFDSFDAFMFQTMS